ncbi:MAG: hypothetical protein MJ230_05135 [bacterium]|nr:hypothetical protein [bacterium]
MYVNKCIKCGAEFETKNPKRVICPTCLYADKGESTEEKPVQSYSSYSVEQRPRNYDRPQQGGYRNNNHNGGQRDYNRDRTQGGYQRRDNNNRGGYRQGNNNNGGRDNRDNRGFRNNYASGGRNNNNFQRKPNFNRKPRPQKQAKPLFIDREQMEQIEALYKTMLPLPNPDAHEVIGAHIGMEPQKVFFGINLVRQKMMLPKLPFPKRKLAISPDQLNAIKMLYEPLLPLPPIGCHKIIAAQLKMDEWRVHVGIKLVRTQMGLERWNEERSDKPADYMVAKHPKVKPEKEKSDDNAKPTESVEVAEPVNSAEVVEPEKPKRGRKPKKKEDEE